MIEKIILDLDGTLLDGKIRYYKCFCDILMEKEKEKILFSMEKYWKMRRNRVNHKTQLEMMGAKAFYNRFKQEWVKRIEYKKYLAFDKLHERVPQVLKEWKDSGIELFLATHRKNRFNLGWQLENLKLKQFFSQVITFGSSKSQIKKKRILQRKISNFCAKNTLWIGDTELDIEFSRTLGIKVCALFCGLRKPQFLSTYKPDYLEADLRSFSKRIKKYL